MTKHSIAKLLKIPSVAAWAGNLSLSPDGRYAATSWNKSGTWQLWLVPLGGGRPKQLTHGTDSISTPRFSPDGSKIAFLQDYDGAEQYDVFIYDMLTGEIRNAMPDTSDSLIDAMSWSPDSRHVAITSNRAGLFAVHTLNIETGELKRVSDHNQSDLSPAWSPSGKHIAFSAMANGQEANTFIVSLEDGTLKVIAEGGKQVDGWLPAWSPDGTRLALMGLRGQSDIAMYDLATDSLFWVAEDLWDEESPSWAPDGKRIAYTLNKHGSVSVMVVDVDSRRRRHYEIEPGYHTDPKFTTDGNAIVCVFHNARRPADLWRLDLKSGAATQLTRSQPAGIKPSAFVQPTTVRWKAPDGMTIHGLLYSPKGKARRRPAIINIHGGPAWQYMNIWSPTVQAWVNEGWVVLCPNYRGSTGYGKAFQTANRFLMGVADIADIVAGADYLVRRGLADPKRIGITGNSYGGYMTMCGLTKYPDWFAVGSAVVPFINWFTEFEHEREDLKFWDLQNMGDPVSDADRYREASPAFFLDRIVAPVQLLAGAHDPRCPPSETQQAVDELTRLGKTHEAMIFPDEGHGFLKIKNRVTAYRQQLAFFKKHLG